MACRHTSENPPITAPSSTRYACRAQGDQAPGGPSMWISWPPVVISPRAPGGVWQITRFIRLMGFMVLLQIGAALRWGLMTWRCRGLLPPPRHELHVPHAPNQVGDIFIE